MAKQAMMYCPHCRKVGQTRSELYTEMPETDVFRCNNGHAFGSYLILKEMQPDLVKLIPHETPQPNQMKAEFWVDKDILEKFRAAYPYQQSSTVESILGLYLTGEVVIIDGVQAEKLKAFNVKTGQDVVAAIEVTKSLEAELETTKGQVAYFEGIFKRASVMAEEA